MSTRFLKHGFFLAVLTFLMIVASGVSAFAHTTIEPAEAEAGSYNIYSFKVPNESDTASTIKLEVAIPQDHPISYVGVTDQDGWNVTVEKTAPKEKVVSHGEEIAEVVSKITWEGGKIGPGKYAVFHVYLGPLPEDVDHLVFKAIQTYDNGEVSRWIDEPQEGEEPEYPAPVLAIAESTSSGHDVTTSSGGESVTKSGDVSTDGSENTLAYVGIGTAIVALFVAVGAFVKKK